MKFFGEKYYLAIKISTMKKHLVFTFILTGLLVFSFQISAQELKGKTISTLKLIDPDNNPKDIPYLGEKVVMVLYTDPDEKDVNDPLSNAVKAKKFPDAKYQGIGIANCKDTWIPDAAIRMKARQKQEQFPGSVILLDEDKTVSKSWELGECNNYGVVIVIGKDKKVKYFKKIATQDESKDVSSEVIRVIEEELAKI